MKFSSKNHPTSLFNLNLKLTFPKVFRCPFGKYAEQHKQVLYALCEEDRTKRLASARKAFTEFYTNTNLSVLTFTMAEEFRAKCHNVEELKHELLSYQCDLLALQLDMRLYPFLSYQLTEKTIQELDQETPAYVHFSKGVITRLIQTTFSEDGFGEPKDIFELSDILYTTFKKQFDSGMTNPTIIPNRTPGTTAEDDVVRLFPFTADFMYEYEVEFCNDPLRNQNLFCLVLCPFYPKEFGRYHKDIQMVFTRESDNTQVSEDERGILRTQSNTLLRNAGIDVPWDEDGKEVYSPEGGVWIPDWPKKK